MPETGQLSLLSLGFEMAPCIIFRILFFPSKREKFTINNKFKKIYFYKNTNVSLLFIFKNSLSLGYFIEIPHEFL